MGLTAASNRNELFLKVFLIGWYGPKKVLRGIGLRQSIRPHLETMAFANATEGMLELYLGLNCAGLGAILWSNLDLLDYVSSLSLPSLFSSSSPSDDAASEAESLMDAAESELLFESASLSA